MLSFVSLMSVLASSPAAETPLRVMSFNIRYGTANDGPDRWEVRKDRTFAVLRKHRPEVLGLQEALAFQIDAIRAALPGYGMVGVGRDDGRATGEYAAIFYDTTRLLALRSDTFWLSDTPTVPASKHWGNRIPRIATWAFFRDLRTGRHFYLFNVHLDHESQPSRERGIELLLRRIRERSTSDPVLLTGDLNADESNPVVAQIRAGGFRDSFRVLHPEAKGGTFTGFRDAPGEGKIDYVFVDRGWTVQEAALVPDKVDGRWPSDHLPVTATLALE